MSRFKDGKGGGKGKRINPSLKAIRRKKRSPQLFANFDMSPTDLGLSATIYGASGASGTYTVPKGVDSMTVELVGGGGGGGGQRVLKNGSIQAGGGGGAGGRMVLSFTEIAPGTVLTFFVGAGGASAGNASHGEDGQTTHMTYDGVTYYANGGEGAETAALVIGSTKDGSGGIPTKTATGFYASQVQGQTGDAKNLDGTPGYSVAHGGEAGAGMGGTGATGAMAGNPYQQSDGVGGHVKFT